MGPKLRIKVSDAGEILVATEDEPEGCWHVISEAESLSIAHRVIAKQTAKDEPPAPPLVPSVSVGDRFREPPYNGRDGDVWRVEGKLVLASEAAGETVWEFRRDVPTTDWAARRWLGLTETMLREQGWAPVPPSLAGEVGR